MATSDSKAPLRTVKRVQFGILSPDEIVSGLYAARDTRKNANFYEGHFYRDNPKFPFSATLCNASYYTVVTVFCRIKV